MSKTTPKTAPKAKAFRKANDTRELRIAKQASAREAIGPITPGQDVFVLTFGQFSLIDVLVHVLDEIGPASVDISTWTAAHADVQRAADLMSAAAITKLRFVVDRSFETRQPEYCAHMRLLFGEDCIRATRTHAKFIVIRNERANVVVRTSMNLNENPRLENVEVSESREFAEWFTGVVDAIFADLEPRHNESALNLPSLQESFDFRECEAQAIPLSTLTVPETTHVLTRS
ncbi:MAG: hypothetical protein KC668_29835 [Myxococcales bacterium]|nr:hypothetical protein [Myxococcales bacterium]